MFFAIQLMNRSRFVRAVHIVHGGRADSTIAIHRWTAILSIWCWFWIRWISPQEALSHSLKAKIRAFLGLPGWTVNPASFGPCLGCILDPLRNGLGLGNVVESLKPCPAQPKHVYSWLVWISLARKFYLKINPVQNIFTPIKKITANKRYMCKNYTCKWLPKKGPPTFFFFFCYFRYTGDMNLCTPTALPTYTFDTQVPYQLGYRLGRPRVIKFHNFMRPDVIV